MSFSTLSLRFYFNILEFPNRFISRLLFCTSRSDEVHKDFKIFIMDISVIFIFGPLTFSSVKLHRCDGLRIYSAVEALLVYAGYTITASA